MLVVTSPDFYAAPARSGWLKRSAILSARRAHTLARATQPAKHSWLFMDRRTNGNDNAEHLFRYVRTEQPQLDVRFVVERDTPTWDRLTDLGFADDLIPYGSAEWRRTLLYCAAIVSSHLNEPVIAPNSIVRWRHTPPRYIYLGHGVNQGDASSWMRRHVIDHLITSTPSEHRYMTSAEGPYQYSRDSVSLTGLPRWDRLMHLTEAVEDTILVAPTWRHPLHLLSPELFWQSTYVKAWSDGIAAITAEAKHNTRDNTRIVLLGHPMLAHQGDGWESAGVDLVASYEDDLRPLFSRTRFLVTDYSSAAFDLAYADRPTVYYQFDRANFLAGEHPCKPSCFDYQAEGFGPVATDLDGLRGAVHDVLDTSSPIREILSRRRAETFAWIDDHNSQRTYDAIITAMGEGKA